jgi:hypothetical protein
MPWLKGIDVLHQGWQAAAITPTMAHAHAAAPNTSVHPDHFRDIAPRRPRHGIRIGLEIKRN